MSSIFHRLRKVNPRRKDGMDSMWVPQLQFDIQNKRDIDDTSTWSFQFSFNVKLS